MRRFIRQDVAELHAPVCASPSSASARALSRISSRSSRKPRALTRDNTGLKLIVAFNYGSRQEIARAAREIAPQGARRAGSIPTAMTPELYSPVTLTPAGIPDPDLLIRTSGEQRLSNYLLWQCAYTEFVFVDEYWPDFTRETLSARCSEYLTRERRFGGITAQIRLMARNGAAATPNGAISDVQRCCRRMSHSGRACRRMAGRGVVHAPGGRAWRCSWRTNGPTSSMSGNALQFALHCGRRSVRGRSCRCKTGSGDACSPSPPAGDCRLHSEASRILRTRAMALSWAYPMSACRPWPS